MTTSDAVTLLPDPAGAPALPAFAPDEVAAARAYVDASRAASTRRAYDGDWRRFSQWCRERDAPV